MSKTPEKIRVNGHVYVLARRPKIYFEDLAAAVEGIVRSVPRLMRDLVGPDRIKIFSRERGVDSNQQKELTVWVRDNALNVQPFKGMVNQIQLGGKEDLLEALAHALVENGLLGGREKDDVLRDAPDLMQYHGSAKVRRTAQLQPLLQQYESLNEPLLKAVGNLNPEGLKKLLTGAHQSVLGKKAEPAVQTLTQVKGGLDAMSKKIGELIEVTNTIAGHLGMGGE